MNIAQLIQANWPIFTAVAVLALLVVIWLIGRATRPKSRDRRPDVLDEGAAPAQRNQALIDAPPAAAVGLPPILASVSEDRLAKVAQPAPVAPVVPVTQPIVQTAPVATSDITPPAVVEEAAEAVTGVPAAPVEKPTVQAAPEPVVQPVATPVLEAPAAPAAPVIPVDAAPAEADDLRRIKGLGPKLVATLGVLGVTRFSQIAAWTEADLDELDTKLGAFAGRPRRDNWIEQARLLSGGDTTAYEQKFGKL